ncbi:MAG: 16S rRNA (uracil(1498)-N(3))-methyltransferase [Pseudomonadota bacterium]
MSPLPRLYVPDDLDSEALIEPNANQANYLLRVLRLSNGGAVRVFNGRDGEWRATLTVSGRSAHLTAKNQIRQQVFVPDLELAFAPLKKTRTDFVVEKATELGVRTISPVLTQYTQTQRVRTDRFRSLSIEAAEQTERLDLPEISEAMRLDVWLSDKTEDRLLIFCDETGTDGVLASSLSGMAEGPSTILIGPEGGFSEQERQMLRRTPGVLPVTLGPRILRAETAAVAALSIWQSFLGDWRNSPYVAQTANDAGGPA